MRLISFRQGRCARLVKALLGVQLLFAPTPSGGQGEVASPALSQSGVSAPRWPARGEVFVVAHRACWSAAPENSLAAIQRCRRLGVEAVEIDVQLTRDGKLVVFHDRELERMTDGSGRLADHTYEELQQLRLKERDGVGSDIVGRPFLTRHRIPLLSEVFEAAGPELLFNLEIKANARWNFDETLRAAIDVADVTAAEPRVFWKIPSPRRGGADASTPADAVYRSLPLEGLTMAAPLIWRSPRPFANQLADFAEERVEIFELVSDDETYWSLGADGRIVGSDDAIYMGVSILPEWGGEFTDEAALLDPDAAWGRMIERGFRMIMTDRPEQLRLYIDMRKGSGN
jgi:glycerophosphoryl diester phosphodiesterase